MNFILQFGEGNFLRAFAEEYIQNTDYKAVICQPRTNTRVINALKAQNNEYDVIVRGRLNGEIIDKREHIDCILDSVDTVGEYDKLKNYFCSDDLKIVISNTTEAGIAFVDSDKIENAPLVSFPAKVTALLLERFNNGKAPLVFLPCELIEDNGDNLKACILKYAELWNLPSEFVSYVNENSFCNTLVDRIVTGHIEFDNDPCSVACEPYKSWIIAGDERAKNTIPFSGVEFADSLLEYRNRKVRILNGTHTMSVLCGYMLGIDIVRDMMNDELMAEYIARGLDEIKSTLSIPCDDFANAVIERFNNPFIDHKLLDISLNSVSKFKARCLDTIVDYFNENGELPRALSFSLSALIAFYTHLSDREYTVNDSEDVLAFFSSNPSVKEILENKSFWGMDLTKIDGLLEMTENYISKIKADGLEATVREVVNG